MTEDDGGAQREGAAPPIAFALDFATAEEARGAAREVAGAVGMVKVGLELFVHEGPPVVAVGREVGLPVFLDLKLHDIPETVERAVAQVAGMGVRLVTVHASGGREMLGRAVRRAEKENTGLAICAVTALTSLDAGDVADLGVVVSGARSPATLWAERLARMAYESGVRWFVCSAAEVAFVRAATGPDAVLVTPGVRPAGAGAGDQKRVATPEQAAKDGADWVVVGRPIRDAADRVAAARAIGEELARGRAARLAHATRSEGR